MVLRLLPAIFALAVMFAPVPDAGAVTLREELGDLLRNHPRLKAEQNRANSASEQVRRAFADYLPKITLSGDYGPEYVDSPAQTSSTRLSRRKTTLALNQNVFDGFRTPENHKAAGLRELVAQQRVAAIRQSLLIEGITAYYDVLRQARLIRIATVNENAIKTQLRLEDERVRRGGGIAVDALLAKTRLQLARERTVQLVGLREEARARYLQIFGHAAIVADMSDPKLSPGALPDDVDSAVAVSTTTNPALLASKVETEVADHTVGAAKSDFFPRIDLVAQANRENDVDAVKGVRRDWSVLLRASWEIFSGFGTTANVASAARDRAAAQDTYLFNRRKIDEELRIAWQQLKTARERVRLLDNAAVIANEVFVARRRLRDSGKETAINVLDAQTELFNAQMNSISASFDAEVASFRVLFTMGMLTTENLGL